MKKLNALLAVMAAMCSFVPMGYDKPKFGNKEAAEQKRARRRARNLGVKR